MHVNVSRWSRWADAVGHVVFRTRYALAHNILDVAIDAVPEYASVGVSSRFPGGIHVSSPGSQCGYLQAYRSGFPSRQCRHLPQAHRDMTRMVAVVDVGRPDDHSSHRRSGSISRCHSWLC